MRIFIDSSDPAEIEKAYSWGIADGVTTNPSLVKKAMQKSTGQKLDNVLKKILRIAKGTPVSLEVTGTSAEVMIAQGKKLFKRYNPIAKNVYIKIPVSTALNDTQDQFEGLIAIKQLSKLGIPINCTLIFTPEQALLAAKAGANFVSPFAGRIDDLIRKQNKIKFQKTDYFPAEGTQKGKKLLEDNGIVSGIDLVNQCVQILQDYDTEVLAASLRNPRQVREAALVGADIATLPFEVIQDMLKHSKTFEGMKNFIKDTVPEYRKLME